MRGPIGQQVCQVSSSLWVTYSERIIATSGSYYGVTGANTGPVSVTFGDTFSEGGWH
ncbi:hypothetical protein DPMN_194447 [Dreissena polymorpha]|uniref:Uncharacterized protein n=1 Tax=Dreissena polymorpha TaxID=45954 RepID=A0A9D3XZV0_DREPO|nr:hypothetical protein DPMN_194447 [Dreissena polymorpha]